MDPLAQPLILARGPAWKNRLVLAPLTNRQSHADGTLADAEFHWLTMRAQGGFAVTMTCAAHVQANGKAFAGQLAVCDDRHMPGLARLAAGIAAAGSVPMIQLHHGGIRADRALAGELVGPSADAETGARELTTGEVEQVRDAFIAAAVRAQSAGFAAAEVHGAHGYLLAQFLSAQSNRRTDRYGGSLANRARLIGEVITGIREACGPDFQIGLRLSPERFGQSLPEVRELAGHLMANDAIDFLDLSLWDTFKAPSDPEFADRTLLGCFTDLPRGKVRLGAAGKLGSRDQAERALADGCDFVVVGKSAIAAHDFAARTLGDPAFAPPPLPVSEELLAREGLSPDFIAYMHTFPGFVAPAEQG